MSWQNRVLALVVRDGTSPAVCWVDLASRGMNWASRLIRESMRTDGASILTPAATIPDDSDKRRLLRPCCNFGETPKPTRETRVPPLDNLCVSPAKGALGVAIPEAV